MTYLKECSKCKIFHPISSFHKNNQSKDGFAHACSECANLYSKKYRKENKEQYNRKQKESQLSRMAMGYCKFCKMPKLENSKMCERHWFENVSIKHFGDVSQSDALKKLAENQNWQCKYTGEKLSPSNNMSLDHIISKHDRPELAKDINNVQWTTENINRAKGRLSHNGFISMCELVIKNSKLGS